MKKIELTKKYFKFNYDTPTTYAFHALALNYFVHEVLSKRKDKWSTHLYFRLFRVGMLGDILYNAGNEKIDSDEHDVNHEMLAALFEGYLVLARSIYDYLLIFLKENYGVTESSFNKFLKKLSEDKYENIDQKFKDHLNNTIFRDLRSLRDSVTHKTAGVMIYVKNGEYRVDGTIYRDDGSSESFDESLRVLIFGYTTSLLLLMSYIAEKITGKSFSEQINKEDLVQKGEPLGSIAF